jgi:hypothetical protein
MADLDDPYKRRLRRIVPGPKAYPQAMAWCPKGRPPRYFDVAPGMPAFFCDCCGFVPGISRLERESTRAVTPKIGDPAGLFSDFGGDPDDELDARDRIGVWTGGVFEMRPPLFQHLELVGEIIDTLADGSIHLELLKL